MLLETVIDFGGVNAGSITQVVSRMYLPCGSVLQVPFVHHPSVKVVGRVEFVA